MSGLYLYRKVPRKVEFCVSDSANAVDAREECLMALNFAIGVKMYQSCMQWGLQPQSRRAL
eukprot:776795-Amphidinium_carterae.1